MITKYFVVKINEKGKKKQPQHEVVF